MSFNDQRSPKSISASPTKKGVLREITLDLIILVLRRRGLQREIRYRGRCKWCSSRRSCVASWTLSFSCNRAIYENKNISKKISKFKNRMRYWYDNKRRRNKLKWPRTRKHLGYKDIQSLMWTLYFLSLLFWCYPDNTKVMH